MFEELYKKTFYFLFYKKRKKYLKELIGEFDEKKDELYSLEKNEPLVQGDIISEIVFLNILENGKAIKKQKKGMIISNSCDIENDDSFLVAPVYDFEEMALIHNGNEGYLNDLKSNHIFEMFYLPQFKKHKGFVADFSETTSFDSNYINSNFKENKLDRISSLSLNGWYFLMNKLALYLFRPESTEVIRSK